MRGYPLPRVLLTSLALVTVALAGSALAGCGTDAGPPEVATAVAGSATPAASASAGGAVAEYVAAQREWVGCMRGRGYDLPDPNARGRVDLDLRRLGVTVKTDPKFVAAQRACQKYLKEVPEELLEREVLTAEQIARRRAYAACMRENGVPTFRDPGPDGNWGREGPNPDSSNEGVKNQFKAGLICEPLLEGKPANPDATEPPGAKG